MDDLIRRKDALQAISQLPLPSSVQKERIMEALNGVPVVHGRWIEGAENFTCGNHNAECSVCGCNISWNGIDEDWNFCPNCGAKMDGGAENG